jgi:CRP/FNR family transcriptional regulator, cyclic AMP receptor protein
MNQPISTVAASPIRSASALPSRARTHAAPKSEGGSVTGLLVQVLETVDFLIDEPRAVAAAFMTLGSTKTLPKGHVVWRAGQKPESIVVSLDGEMAAVGWDPGGRGICYAFFATGQCAGIPAVLDGLPQPRDVQVIRGGAFFVVDRVSFLQFLDTHPTVRARAFASVDRLVRAGIEERDRDVFLPVHARVARFLLGRACLRQTDGARMLLRETQPEIAIRLGSVREVVARVMASFGEQGVIRRTRHALFVCDWSALSEKAGFTRDESRSRDAESALLRTRRFFAPAFSDGPAAVADEARACGEHLTTLRECVVSGCPLAVAALPTGSSSRRDVGYAPQVERALASPTGSAAGPSVRRRGTRAPAVADGEARPASIDAGHAAPIEDRPRRKAELLARPRRIDQAGSRNPAEGHEIRRRVALYRKRAAGIESRFGAKGIVPASLSVFR